MTAPEGPTPWEHAQRLHAEGKTPPQITERLAATGLDPDSIRVLLNSLPDARMPQALPTANLDLSTNTLAPSHFSVFELGLQGEPRTIGLYWLAFGVALAAIVGAVTLVTSLGAHEPTGLDSPENPDAWDFAVSAVLPRVGFGLALVAVSRGAYLWLTSVTIRRKP